MKHISTLAFIFVFFFSGLAQNQEINQPENIAEFGWNTENGLPYIKSTDVNYGVSSFELLPSGEIAFLNQKDNRIDIYNNVSEKFVTAIKLNVPASDFTYYNNMFYVLSRKNVVVISETGEILKTIQIPASVQVAEYLRVVDGQLCVLTPAGETIRISDNETDIFQGWIVKKDVYLKTAVSDNGTFQLQSFNGRKPTESKSYHLSTKISSARIIGLVNDMALIDAASIVSEKPLRVKREIVAVSLVNGAPGELIGSIELPNMYYIHTKHDLFTNSDGLFFLLTTPDKAVVYKIPIETNGVSPVLPQFLPAILQQFYHYNDHLLEEPNDGQGMINSDQQTERAPILRSQMIANAEPYETHVWYCNANNILNYSCGGVTVETPAWVQVGYNVSVPYCWGGWSSLPNYDQGLLNGVSAGDCNCVGSGSGESCAVGVDCSGFVSRAWNLPNKYGTSTLPNISTEYVSYSQLLPGDIVNYAGHHVRLVHTLNTDGSFLMIEASASATNWSVGYASYTVTNLQGYYLPRYYVDVVNDPLDTVAPQTAVTAPVWATDDFSATFADSDNDSVSRHFMLVSDFDGTEWRANGDYGYFNDNFSSAIHPDWTVVDGSWAIAGGALNQSNEALSADNIYAAVQQDSGYAYLYHWKMKITGSGTNRRGGIYFFSDDPTLLQRNNAYMIYYKADGDAIEIYKSINNSISLMNSSSCVIDADTWFDCKVIFNQPTGDIWVFRNDDFVAAWKDASPHTSGIAISCRNGGSNMFYDDMQVFRSRSMAA
ncbi:MAG: hypothetical protein KKA07_02270, partial [Bacteroidetes bacterium]|nr:hypothetical protein [Bacteroidota bacterium]